MTLKPPDESNSPLTRTNVTNVQTDGGARGDGTTDDGTAFTSAFTEAGHGGMVWAPRATYRLGDRSFTAEGQTLCGEGMGYSAGTILKAKTSATYVLKNQGLRYQSLRDLVISGNNRASRGMLSESTAGATSQALDLHRVRFYQCTKGLHLGNTGLTQADKNTLIGCHFTECDVGLWNESVNGQNTILINCDFSSTYDTSIAMAGGSLSMIGGQFQGGTGTKGIDFTGSNVDWVNLQDVIFEGPTTDINGASFWPRDGVRCENVTFQGSTANVVMGVANSVLVLDSCRFNDSPSTGGGQITVNATGCVIVLQNARYGVPTIDGSQAANVTVFKPDDINAGVYWRGSANAGINGDLDVQTGSGAAARVRMGDSFPLNGAHYPSIYLGPSLDVNLYREPTTTPTLRTDDPFTLPTYTTAGRPTATNVQAGTLIYVSDAAAGSRLQIQHGGAWVGVG